MSVGALVIAMQNLNRVTQAQIDQAPALQQAIGGIQLTGGGSTIERDPQSALGMFTGSFKGEAGEALKEAVRDAVNEALGEPSGSRGPESFREAMMRQQRELIERMLNTPLGTSPGGRPVPITALNDYFKISAQLRNTDRQNPMDQRERNRLELTLKNLELLLAQFTRGGRDLDFLGIRRGYYDQLYRQGKF